MPTAETGLGGPAAETAQSGPAQCPSAPGLPGASLTGVVGRDGRTARLGTPLPVDQAFLDAAGAEIGRRFRFTAPCLEDGCQQWSGAACGLIGRLRERASDAGLAADPALPRCAIRATCRWWGQDGAAACGVCALVVYDASPAG